MISEFQLDLDPHIVGVITDGILLIKFYKENGVIYQYVLLMKHILLFVIFCTRKGN